MNFRSFPFRSSFAFLAILALPLLLSAQAAQQEAAKADSKADEKQPFKLSVGTNLVIVPVVVSDKHGEHVPGLKAEDFELKEEGTAQKIVGVEEVTGESGRGERPVPLGPKSFGNHVVERPKRLVIIALDQINTPFEYARDGHRAVVDFLSKSVDETTLVSLVAIQHNGVRIIHDFTSDPAVLVAAVEKVKGVINSRDSHALDALGENTPADLEALQLAAILNGAAVTGGATPAEMLAAARAGIAGQRAQLDAARQAQDSLITLENFQQIAQYFWGVPGRKSLLWASSGFPFAIGSAAQANTRGTLPDDWQRTFRMLSDANIAIYPVDVGGLLPGVNPNNLQTLNAAALKASSNSGAEGGAGARSQMLGKVESGELLDPSAGRHDTMRQIADMTGGLPYYNSNDVAGLMRQARGDAAKYYSLAYYTKSSGKPGWRKLNLKVRHDNVKIRYRSGFFFHDAVNEAEDARRNDEMMALRSDVDFTALPLTGVWGKVEPAGNDRKVNFMLSIPAGVPLVDTERQNHINFDFRAVALDSSGKVVANLGERMETNLAAENLAQIQGRGLDYTNVLTLPPGQYKVRFVVRDNLKGTLGSVTTPLKVE